MEDSISLPVSDEELLGCLPWTNAYHLNRFGENPLTRYSGYKWDGQEVIRPEVISGIAEINKNFVLTYHALGFQLSHFATLTDKACASVRICIILGFINCGRPFSQLFSFITAGITDEMLPLSMNVLSNILSDPTVTHNFWALQFRACPSPKVVDDYEHVEFQRKAQVPLQHLSNLGHGAFGSVDCVRNVINGAVYARKVFHPLAQRKRVVVGFQKEMDVIRRLKKHRHAVTYIGSYVAGSELGILLLPVADQNLHDYLHGLNSGEHGSESILLNSFGCLTTGLAFMHDEGIRHKDIKPANILLHGNNVLFADFGLAFDFENLDTSATSGNVGAMTKKYSAREVHESLRRDTRSDVFSLGCVFLEICTILAGLGLDELEEALLGDSGGDSWWEEGIYAFNTLAVEKHLAQIEKTGWLTRPANWCRSMMKDNSCERPRMQAFKDTMWSDLADEDQRCQYFCHPCLYELELTSSASKKEEGKKAEYAAHVARMRSFGEFKSPFPQDSVHELSFTWAMFERLVNVYWQKPNRAVEASREQLLNLGSGARIHRTDKMRGRALCLAADIGDLDLIQRLLRAGVQTNFSDVLTPRDPDGLISGTSLRLYPPLMMAALDSHEEVIRMLIHHGANVNESDSVSGATVLHYAACKSRRLVIEVLLDAGAEIERKNRHGETPLFYAARGALTPSRILSSNFGAMKLLLSRNANINAQDHLGTTVLQIAAYSRDAILLRKLLECGALPTITDKRGRNALHCSVYAFPDGSFNGTNCGFLRHGLNQEDCIPIITQLLELGVDINSQTIDDGRTALLIAFHTGQDQIEIYLSFEGAATDTKDILGKDYRDYKLEANLRRIPSPDLGTPPYLLSLLPMMHQMEIPRRFEEPRFKDVAWGQERPVYA